MDEEEVKERVDLINKCKGDYEAAHDMEDELYIDVLKHIAEGGENAQQLAKEALKSQEIDFVRYTA